MGIMKIRLLFFFLFLLLGCEQNPRKKTELGKQQLKYVETEFLKFEEFLNQQNNPCDTFSIEVSEIYEDLATLPPAHLDTAFLDNELKKKGFKTINSGWGNFEKGPRILVLELSDGKCKCKIFKKYVLIESQGDNGENKYYYRIFEKIVCNALNNAVE